MRMLKYIVRELLNNRRFCILFILNLSLGLTGFIALDGFKASLEKTIKARSKGVLGADLGLSSRRPIKDNELKIVKSSIDSEIEQSKMVEMFSMVANTNGKSRLFQLKAIQNNYPFYGKIEFDKTNYNRDIIHQEKKVLVYPEVLQQLRVKVGDDLKIGNKSFTIDGVVLNDSAAGISTNMAPRIYLGLKQLQDTGLLRPGSIAWYSRVFKAESLNGPSLEEARDKIYKSLDNPDVRVYTHENASSQMTRLFSRLNDFLGLASLVALFLAGLGSGFLFRAYFKSKVKQIATLICLGATHTKAFSHYLIQIFLLGLLSSVFAILLSYLIVPGLGAVTKGLLPFPIEFIINPNTILLGVILGTLGSILICLPILIELIQLKPSLLFIDKQSNSKTSLKSIIATLPAMILFWALSVWLSHSIKIGSLFTIAFLLSAIILSIGSLLFFSNLNIIKNEKLLSLNWALKSLARNKFTTLACFVSIGLGTLLLNLIPQLQSSIDQELQRPETSKVPSLFMFDIQEEQVDQLQNIIKDENSKLTQLSPMIRARLITVNGEEFSKGKGASAKAQTREQEREMRFRNRGFNLSYRNELIASEEIIEGKPFSGIYDESSNKLPEISLEKRFASRLNLKIGDRLKFEIESIPVEGKVINFRSVRWASFQPNFFIQFQPGVLEIAPKTFIATLPSSKKEVKYNIQDRIVEKLPNVSIIDVSRLVSRISQIMEQMAWALNLMSVLCLIAGFVVIYSIANHQASSNKWDIALLKSLGASFPSIRGQFIWQFALISLFASSLGAGISLLMSYLMSSILFEGTWAFNLLTPILTVFGCLSITILITDFATQNALKIPSRELLSN